MNTKALIASLSREVQARKPRSPGYWVGCLLAVLVTYAVGIQVVLGLRPDLDIQFTRLFFGVEIFLLGMLVLVSAVACVLAMYPDTYQKPSWLKLPYLVSLLLVGLVVLQLFMPTDLHKVMPLPGAHERECALCIGAVALLPAALIFALLRQGASVHQLQAGALAVLAASSIGCLALRLSEANDSIIHLINWHYVPTLLFAFLGACLGRWLLRW